MEGRGVRERVRGEDEETGEGNGRGGEGKLGRWEGGGERGGRERWERERWERFQPHPLGMLCI